MAITSLPETIHEQLQQGINVGMSDITCNLPVASLDSNQIVIAADRNKIHAAPHDFHLAEHPTGAITASLESSFGLACPTPLPVFGRSVEEAELMFPLRKNYKGLVVVSDEATFRLLGYGFEGDYTPVTGVCAEHIKVFAAQIAGLILRKSSQ